MSTVAILAAAGRGDRLGKPKQLLDLGGKPLAAWSLELFERAGSISAIYIACEADDRARFQEVASEYAPSKVRGIVAGGATRQVSVHAALSAVLPAPQLVLVHDGARPFLTLDVVDRVIAAAHHGVSAVAAVPVKDTIKQAQGTAVKWTVERASLWSAQTPQVFPYDVLVAAHVQALKDGFTGTDDASLVERLGAPVNLVMGSYGNIKVTTPDDLELARLMAEKMQAPLR